MRDTRVKLHPITGRVIRPVGFRKNGRPIMPILGASEDGDQGGKSDDGDQSGNDDGDKGGKSDDGDQSGNDDGDKSKDKGGKSDPGYPADTPIADMTDAQQAAYWRAHAQKHERAWRNKAGDVTPEKFAEIVAENEKLREAQMSESERSIAEAKKAGRDEAIAEANTKVIDAHVTAFMTARGVKRDEIQDTLDALDLSKFITDDLDVDTDKLASVLDRIAPATGQSGGSWPDMGQGNRGKGGNATGVSAGADLYDTIHGKK